MELNQVQEILGLASSAVGVTGKAASTIAAIQSLFERGDEGNNEEAAKLLNTLASDLTAANIMNVQLSEALKKLSTEISREDRFEEAKSRYELHDTGRGAFVFRLKESTANSEPMHCICPVCLNQDQLISYLRNESDYFRCQTNTHHLFPC